MAKTNAAFMSGVPELVILRLLSQREMYGYELVRAIRLTSSDALSLAEGVVYPTLHSLESRGLLKAKDKVVDARARVYYRTTNKGDKQLQKLQGEWQRVNNGIQRILGATSAQHQLA